MIWSVFLGCSESGLCSVREPYPSIGAKPDTELEEITVTARKRPESILKVPIDDQVIPDRRLQALHSVELTDLPTIVPGLNFGHSLLSIGTLASIRGIGTAAQDPGVDQSVSLNLDGLSLGNGLAFNAALFDLDSVEVLKGPQALFYGKESPGGVIALRSADPTDQFELIGRIAYEFESIQPRAELIASGPVSDGLRLRLAGLFSGRRGYFYNEATAEPGTGALTPRHDRDPDSTNFIIRGTALWDLSSQLDARLKLNIAYDHSIHAETFQFTSCPSGTAPVPSYPNFLGGGENCVLDRIQRTVDLDPAAFPEILNNGVPFLTTDQKYGTLELNYRPSAELTVSSTTGYYDLTSSSMINGVESTYAGTSIGVNNRYHRRQFTEEVRASSNFPTSLNYTVGALYEDGNFDQHVQTLGNRAYGLPAQLNDGVTPVSIRTYSLFGQIRWAVIQRLELAAGARWTDEKRAESPYNLLTGEPTPVPEPSIHFDNTSPEVTLTYEATGDVTLYGAYKQAFKSGSFSVASPPVAGKDNSFGEEKVHGGEAGLRSRLLDHQLWLNATTYLYHYDGLQVGVISPPQNGVPHQQTLNAATARTYGVDVDVGFRPAAIRGLDLYGNVEWNRGRYLNFTNAPCWGGQTIALGCNQEFSPLKQTYTAQDLSGTPLIRAPDWQGNVGFEYTMPVMNGYGLTFSNNNAYSTRYVADLAAGRPGNDNYQRTFVKVDVGLALKNPSNVWELALIGKDLGDKVTSGNCASANFKQGVIVANTYGTNTPSPIGYDALGCFADPGREVWLRLTARL